MKKSLFLLTAFAGVLVLTSCKKEEPADLASKSAYHVTVVSTDVETKTQFGDLNNGKYPVTWTTNQDVAFSLAGATLVKATTSIDDSNKGYATFDVPFATEPADSNAIYGFSPMGKFVSAGSSSNKPGFTTINSSYNDVYLNIPSEQTPLVNSCDEAAQALVGETKYDSGKDVITMQFHHAVAYGKMTITNFDKSIKSVELDFPKAVAGTSCYYYYADYTDNGTAYAKGSVRNMDTSIIKLSAENLGGSKVFWFALAPVGTLDSGTLSVIVTDEDGNTYTKPITFSSAKSLPFTQGKVTKFSVSMEGISADPVLYNCTWNLAKDETASASSDNLSWTSSCATMAVDKKSATIATNNYYPGTSGKSYTSTRMYAGSQLTITPVKGCTISKIVCVATTANYATALCGCTWTNATASVADNGTTVTIVPTDGDSAVIAAISGTIGLTSVTVYYTSTSSEPIVTAKDASSVTSSGAVLSATYAGATSTPAEVRFEIGTSESNLSEEVYYNDGGLGTPAGSFSVTVSSLAAGTTYYYRAAIQVGTTDYYSDVKSFTTTSSSGTMTTGWLELPAQTTGSNYYNGHFGSGSTRNYSYLYDKTMYASLWSAYPLTASNISGSNKSENWKYNPDIDKSVQINVVSKSYPTNYNNSNYSRGHQVPAADRVDDATKRAQLYYMTNQVPQLQNKFNGSIWSSLETAVRDLTSGTDTVYVATGLAFQKVGGSETITYLTAASGITPSSIPVANYFWKVLLKVKRTNGTVTSASAIGFWFVHQNYTNNTYSNYAVSVDEIEEYTGFDFFVNLPDEVEDSAEKNTSWSTFQSF